MKLGEKMSGELWGGKGARFRVSPMLEVHLWEVLFSLEQSVRGSVVAAVLHELQTPKRTTRMKLGRPLELTRHWRGAALGEFARGLDWRFSLRCRAPDRTFFPLLMRGLLRGELQHERDV